MMGHRGSSPRIRGECPSLSAPAHGAGIIPANTGRIAAALSICGLVRGSSPRIRGEFIRVNRSGTAFRIIPANTGRIIRTTDGDYRDRDHPREYGENIVAFSAMSTELGSSPRIRGESDQVETVFWSRGIIPANTGRIASPGGSLNSTWDHPREYGENLLYGKSQGRCMGSSPRIRGES